MKKIILIFALLVSQSFGFWGSSSIDKVKNGAFNFNPNITVEKAFNKCSNFTSVSWSEEDGRNGENLVVAKAKLTNKIVRELRASGSIYMQYYFLVDGDNFELIQVAANNNGRLTPTATRNYPETIEKALQDIYNN
ncbi:MAG: hypothetical protein U9Q33_00590 [Campylobacterota bacterium]|nr:hypothetical protein [Campylobacterota bacterium]